MSELITDQIFTDGQKNVNATQVNGIIGKARVQPDVIANKTASATLDVADQMLILKTDNTLARARFDTIVNSTSSALPIADTTKNGSLRQISGKATDFVDGTNHCQPIANFLPPGVVVNFAGPNVPTGWLSCQGQSVSRATYAALFAAIGVTYGAVDGNSFNLPNFVGRFSGWFGALGSTGGASQVALAIGHLPSHAHPIVDVAHTHSATEAAHNHSYVGPNFGPAQAQSGVGAWAQGTVASTTGNAQPAITVAASGSGLSTTQAVGSGTAFSILPPYLCVTKIIKT